MENKKEEQIRELKKGFETACIDYNIQSNLAYRPEFVSNDYKQGKKVITSIERELLNCEEFCISVAFLTQSGITPLLQILQDLEKKNIPGKILTTDYLMFSEPSALETLASLKNIQLKMYCTNTEDGGFHTKGYIFRKDEMYRIIVGSSNMTLNAITKNKEWNTKIVGTEKGEMVQEILKEFNMLWNDEKALDFTEFIEEYKVRYNLQKQQKRIAKQNEIVDFQQYTLKPNKMQVAFIKNLEAIREAGEERALLISATGTGKTYASAFALREMQPKRALFLVHREQIAKQARKSYQKVFGNTKTFGLVSGTHKDFDCDYIFATMQTMSKEDVFTQFDKNTFDCIVLDEAHHVGSDSYQKIMNYFTPKFWLGMTASPENNSYDIYSIFNHQIAYEIRLQQALEEELLCPFHYFGIQDIEIDGKVFDDSTGVQNFNHLVCDTRVDYVIKQAKFYGYSGDRVKGLVFCSRKDEARELSNKFNDRGYRTEVLTGEDNQGTREEVVERLVDDTGREDQLDYIFTVDIFNEGIDIVEVNQVIMLRPTQSPVIFVQQLGRGLRKYEDKEYVVILDFIGNYMNNFMIPMALSGDRSYNKDTIRKYVISGNNIIPGASTIHFDEVSKNRIFSSIDKIKGIKTIIKQSYINLKYRLGRVPYLMDFYREGEVDPLLILKNYKTYQLFLEKMEGEEQKGKITEDENLTLEYLSKTIVSGKRPHELEMLQHLVEDETIDKVQIKKKITEKYGIFVGTETINNAASVLEGKFVSKAEELEKYCHANIVDHTNDNASVLKRVNSFAERLKHAEFSTQINDLLLLGLNRYQDNYSDANNRRGSFILYEKYTRKDVCLLLNWGKDYSSTMYGMKRVGDDVCLFVTYHKVESKDEQNYVSGKPDYADEFLNNQIFAWDSQIGKGPESSYMRDIIEAKNKHLFVKKSDVEIEYYYMGQFDIISVEKDQKEDNLGRMKDIAKVQMKMHDCVHEDLLKYLESVDRREE